MELLAPMASERASIRDRRLKLLVITYAFPPAAWVGSIRPGRFCHYLPDFEIDPTVVTIKNEYADAVDPSMAVPDVPVVRTTVWPNPLDWYSKRRKKASAASPAGNASPHPSAGRKKTLPNLRKHLLALFETPDGEWRWFPPAVRACEDLLAQQHFDAVFSSGPPHIAHLVARKVSSEHSIPWLADFRDPWTSNILRQDQPEWHHRIVDACEARCIHNASLVICNTGRIRDNLARKYLNEAPAKFRTLTNGFDDMPASLSAPAPVRNHLLHLGSLYSTRSVAPFCRAVSDAISAGEINASELRVTFLGYAAPEILAEAQTAAPHLFEGGLIRFLPPVPRREAAEFLAQAGSLLLVQGPHTLQIPAKFYEYLQTGKPVFALTERGALTDLLEETGAGVWSQANDVEDIRRKLSTVLHMPARSAREVGSLYGRFHYRELTRQLAQWIREVAATRRLREP